MRVVVLLGVVLALTVPAHAETCRDLPARKFAQLSSYAQKRFPMGQAWEARKEAWKTVMITIFVDRAPHIARAALAACPGVEVLTIDPVDARRQTSMVHVKVTGFAGLSRLAQLPAVRSITVRDQRRRHIELEDPMF